MKPRLLKFTCHSCGTRLAVPPEMAGLSDQCPKCGVLVTAPLAPPSPPVEMEPEASPAPASETAPPPLAEQFAPPQATEAPAAAPLTPLYASPKAPEMGQNDALAQAAALQKLLGAKPALTGAPEPVGSPADAQAQMAALQKRLGPKPAPMDAPEPVVPPTDAQAQMEALQKRLGPKPASKGVPEPVVAPTDAQAQVATLQKLLGAQPTPMVAPEPVVSPAPAAKVVPEGWSSDALSDALKPSRPGGVPAPSVAPEAPPKEALPKEVAPKEAPASKSAPPLFQKAPSAPNSPAASPPAPSLGATSAFLASLPMQVTVPEPAPVTALAPEPVTPPSEPVSSTAAAAPETLPFGHAPSPPTPPEEKSEPEPPASPMEPPVMITAPPPAVEQAEPPSSRKPAHEVLDSILRRKEPGKPVARLRDKPVPSQSAVSDKGAQALLTDEPRTALVPRQVTDAEEAANAAMPGMGEMLASAAPEPMSSVSQESRPLLHVPFVPIKATPSEERRARMAHLRNMGIICFLLMDVLLIALALLYRQQIAAWWNGDAAPATVAESGQVAPPPAPSAVAEIPVGPPSAPAPESHPPSAASELPHSGSSAPAPATAASAAPTPLASAALLPSTPTDPSALPPEGLTIAAPSDFPSASTAAKPLEKAVGSPEVPMAIPLPGQIEESIPGVAPLTASPSSTPQLSLLPKDGLMSSALPVPPLPDVVSPALGAAVVAAAPTVAPTSPAGVPPSPADSVPTPQSPMATGSSTASSSSASPAPVEPATPTATAAVPAPKKTGKLPAEAKPALEALEKFLAAPTWKERLAYVQKPDSVRAAMEKHAASIGDGPIRAGTINFLERYPSKAGIPPYCMFEVSGGQLDHPVLTLVEQSPKDGPRVDWEAFVEFKDDLLLRFLENKGSPPQKFRGLLRRKHYFDKDVPDIASKDSFELVQPNAHFEGHVFVPRSSAVGKQLANQLPWGQDMPVIAELVWKSDSKAWWVQIENIVSYGWRG